MQHTGFTAGFRRFAAIARLTALETMRQPICLILTTLCIVGVVLFPVLIAHRMGESAKLIRDSGMALHLLTGLILATYAASSTIVKEIRRGTVASILSKPVSREIFILAKFTGIAVVMLMFSTMASLATILSERAGIRAFKVDYWALLPILAFIASAYAYAMWVNYRERRSFSSNAYVLMFIAVIVAFVFSGVMDTNGKFTFMPSTGWDWGSHYNLNLIPACIMVAMGVLMLQAIATAFAIRLEAVPTLSICTVLFALGLTSAYFFGQSDNVIAETAYRLVPNWSRFWMADVLTDRGVVPWSLVFATAGYAALYVGGMLLVTLGIVRAVEIR